MSHILRGSQDFSGAKSKRPLKLLGMTYETLPLAIMSIVFPVKKYSAIVYCIILYRHIAETELILGSLLTSQNPLIGPRTRVLDGLNRLQITSHTLKFSHNL